MPDHAQAGDVALDERGQAFLRISDGTWRHLDMMVVESGQRQQPWGDLLLLRRKNAPG